MPRSTVASARGRRATDAPGHHMQPVADFKHLVQFLTHHQHRAARIAQARISPRICAAAPTSTPQVGWETMSNWVWPRSYAPTMNFCRLPPDSDWLPPAAPAFTLKRRMMSPACFAAPT